MRNLTLILTFLTISFFLNADPYKRSDATFYLKQDGNQLKLHMRFDKIDMLQVLGYDKTEMDTVNFESVINQYVTSNLSFQINKKDLHIQFTEIETSDRFFTIEADLGVVSEKIYLIHVNNTCLVNAITGHKNYIHARFHNQLRKVSMDKTKTMVEFDYLHY